MLQKKLLLISQLLNNLKKIAIKIENFFQDILKSSFQ
jgi:hypothetical protein